MKNIIAFFCLFLFSTILHAQNSIGFKGGLSASTLTKFDLIQNITPDFRYNRSFTGNVFYEMPVNEYFSFQPEISFVNRGLKINNVATVAQVLDLINVDNSILNNSGGIDIFKFEISNTYIQVPLMAKFQFGNPEDAHFYAMVGPQVSVFVNSALRPTILGFSFNKFDLPENIYKPFEIGGVAALGFELPISRNMHALVEGRYDAGFSRTFDTPVVQIDVRNRTFSGVFGLKYTINQ